MILKNIKINLENTLNCGQCFRWKQLSQGEFQGVVHKKVLKIKLIENDLHINFSKATSQNNTQLFANYFDAYTPYEEKLKKLCKYSSVLEKAINFAPGIRILRQDPWETLCSFIISQNNNIPRIKKIIEQLCNNFGKKIDSLHHAFPSAKTLSTLSEEDLNPIKSGFRARYILDAAKKVTKKEVNLSLLKEMPTNKAKKELLKIKGVGHKVADCTLLYAYHRLEVVPKDVWVKRATEIFFNGEKDLTKVFGEHAGLAQIYIFNYIRNNYKNIYK